MKFKVKCTEISIDQSAPWRNRMRFTTEDGEYEAYFPYDETIAIGDNATIEITKQEQN